MFSVTPKHSISNVVQTEKLTMVQLWKILLFSFFIQFHSGLPEKDRIFAFSN